MRNKVSLLMSIIALTFLYSCEYDSDNENYIELPQPQPVEIGIDLAGIKPGDTLYVYAPTNLYIWLSTAGKEVLDMQFTLDESVWSSNYLSIYPSYYDNKIHPLEVDVRLKTNSGSLADKLNMEAYTGHFVYYLKYVPDVDISLIIEQRKTADGYFELVWNNISKRDMEVDYYQISYYDRFLDQSIIKKIPATTSPNISFVDQTFVYDSRTYYVEAFFKKNTIQSVSSYYSPQFNELNSSDITIQAGTSFDDLTVSWKKNEFKCKYLLRYTDLDGQTVDLYTENTSAQIKSAGFPVSNIYVNLYVLPANYQGPAPSYYYNWITAWYNTPTLAGSFRPASYDATNGKIYTYEGYSPATVYIYDANNLQKRTSQSLNISTINALSVSNSSQIALSDYDFTYVFDNKFSLITQFKPISNGNYFNYFELGDNGKLVTAYIYTEQPNADVYDTNKNGKLLYSIPLMAYGSQLTFATTGTYLCNYNSPQFNIYRLDEDKAVSIFSGNEPLGIEECYFNQFNPDELIITTYNKSFYTLNMKTMTKSAVTSGQLICVDPFNGNIVCLDKNYVTNTTINILDPTGKKILFSIKLSQSNFSTLALINNNLIFNNYYINISKNLVK